MQALGERDAPPELESVFEAEHVVDGVSLADGSAVQEEAPLSDVVPGAHGVQFVDAAPE